MGGFVPDCHAQTFVEVAKLEFHMSLFPKLDGRRQTLWGGTSSEFHGTERWYANISPDIDDLNVIEEAKTIVDACRPQVRSTFFGGHYYSFSTREYLLNLLLFYHSHNKRFPVGYICIVDKWVWKVESHKSVDGWVTAHFWRFLPRRKSFEGGDWINVPSFEDAKKQLALKRIR